MRIPDCRHQIARSYHYRRVHHCQYAMRVTSHRHGDSDGVHEFAHRQHPTGRSPVVVSPAEYYDLDPVHRLRAYAVEALLVYRVV